MCHPPHPAPGINSIKTYYHIACTECSDARMNTDTKIYFLFILSALTYVSRKVAATISKDTRRKRTESDSSKLFVYRAASDPSNEIINKTTEKMWKARKSDFHIFFLRFLPSARKRWENERVRSVGGK